MKKIIAIALVFTILVSNSYAQGGPGGGDPAAMKQRMTERMKPQLMEKTKISDAEANKVMDINFDAWQQSRAIRTDAAMSEDDKTKKMNAIQEETAKKYKAIPLTDEQVKAVTSFFEEMRKNRQQGKPAGGNK